MRATQIALVDAVLLGLGDAVPGVEDQQIVDAPILQRERRQLDDIDELARLDEHMLIRLDIDRAEALSGFRHGSGLNSRNGNDNTVAPRATVAVKPPQLVAIATPRRCRSPPQLVAIATPRCCR